MDPENVNRGRKQYKLSDWTGGRKFIFWSYILGRTGGRAPGAPPLNPRLIMTRIIYWILGNIDKIVAHLNVCFRDFGMAIYELIFLCSLTFNYDVLWAFCVLPIWECLMCFHIVINYWYSYNLNVEIIPIDMINMCVFSYRMIKTKS